MQTGETPARPRRLTRSSSDKVIAGVAGGLGAHTGLDPVIFRIGFVALTLTGGLGLLLYVLGALFIPRDDGSPGGNGGLLLAIIAGIFVLFGGAALLSGLLIGMPFMADPLFAARHFGGGLFEIFGSTVIIALALVAVGYLLLRDDRRPRPAAAVKEAPPASAGADAGGVEAAPGAAAAAEPGETMRRSPSTLPWLTLAAVLVALGTVAALDNAGAVEPRAAVYPAVALGVTGGGLLVGSRWGRGKWLLVPLGLLLLPCTIVASATDLPLAGRVGSFFAYTTNASQLDREYEILAGELYLDLSPLEDTSEDVYVDVRVVAGQLSLGVPPGMGVDVTGSIDAGAYNNWLRGGDHREGLSLQVVESIPAHAGFGTVHLDFEQGVGHVEITRAGLGGHVPGGGDHPQGHQQHPWEGTQENAGNNARRDA